ncbi:MAG: transposase [Bacteroidales bacterium]
MPEKFRNKYRIPSTRLVNWDYRWNAPYFITICTKHREHFFGRIADGIMELSEIGKIVESEWIKTYEMRPDMNLQMDEFVVMPNHFHAIIIIGENEFNQNELGHETECGAGFCRDAMHCVSTAMHCVSTVQKPINQFGPQSKNLASIIRGFKTGVTTRARQFCSDFTWQSRFHDHIIRDDDSFQRIQKYIRENPLKWEEDEFYK